MDGGFRVRKIETVVGKFLSLVQNKQTGRMVTSPYSHLLLLDFTRLGSTEVKGWTTEYFYSSPLPLCSGGDKLPTHPDTVPRGLRPSCLFFETPILVKGRQYGRVTHRKDFRSRL